MNEQPKTCAPCRSGNHAHCLGCACAHAAERALAPHPVNPRNAHGDWTWTVDRVVKVVDGDTLDLVLSRPYERDLGFGMHVRGRDVAGPIRFRLLGIDAPEVRDEPEKASAARMFVVRWLMGHPFAPVPQPDLLATTHKSSDRPLPDGAFGRWLVELWDASTGERLADAMRAAGHYKGARLDRQADPDSLLPRGGSCYAVEEGG